MSPHGMYGTPEEVRDAIRDIKSHLDTQDKTYSERRKEDDKREEHSSKQREELLNRVDAHGRRMTVLETEQKAFFGPTGAYHLIVAKTDENSRKLDKILWATLALALTGAGVLLKGALHI